MILPDGREVVVDPAPPRRYAAADIADLRRQAAAKTRPQADRPPRPSPRHEWVEEMHGEPCWIDFTDVDHGPDRGNIVRGFICVGGARTPVLCDLDAPPVRTDHHYTKADLRFQIHAQRWPRWRKTLNRAWGECCGTAARITDRASRRPADARWRRRPPRVVESGALEWAESRWFAEHGPDPDGMKIIASRAVIAGALRRHDRVTSGPVWRRMFCRSWHRTWNAVARPFGRRR